VQRPMQGESEVIADEVNVAVSSMARLYRRVREPLQIAQPSHCLYAGFATHFHRRAESGTEGRPFRLAKYCATLVVQELHTTYSRRFAIRHVGQGRGDGRSDATGTTSATTFHHQAL
jgi:hypothetical protein